jgi:ribosome-associated toxin RatA of RatAB toxin-antitoxin module
MEVIRSALVPYAASDMFDIVERAEHYPAFLPWCSEVTILSRDESSVEAIIGFAWRGVRFKLHTRNPKRRPEWLAVKLAEGPFRRFEGEWHLRALAASACKIEFALAYEFDSVLVRSAAGVVFDRIAGTFVDAFIARAEALFDHAPRAIATPPAGGDPLVGPVA